VLAWLAEHAPAGAEGRAPALSAAGAGEDPRAATRRAQWQIHFCVLLWGFTAILAS
jgi:hypothetical protein